MSLKDDIKELIKTQPKTKSQKIAEVREEIEEMTYAKIPLKKQIELLLKNQIVEKISITEYRRILELDFNYGKKPKSQKPKPQQPINHTQTEQIETTPQPPKRNPAISAKEILSQSINFLS